jgi:hypothetical protein
MPTALQTAMLTSKPGAVSRVVNLFDLKALYIVLNVSVFKYQTPSDQTGNYVNKGTETCLTNLAKLEL